MLLRKCMAEACGTGLQVFLGMMVIASSVTTGVQSGVWQIAVVWAFAITTTIYLTAQISGGHLNPAATIASAVSSTHTGFQWKDVLPYILSQVTGATIGSALVFWAYGSAITTYEERNAIIRGETANSTMSAMIFACYFPNPQLAHTGILNQDAVGPIQAILVELLLTALSIVICRVMTEPRNSSRPHAQQAPFFMAFGVSCLICAGVPLTMSCMNPARDFGPRLIAWLSGWQSVAMPGPQYEMLVYWIGPCLGAVVGTMVYDAICIPAFQATNPSRTTVSSSKKPVSEDRPDSVVVSLSKLQQLLTQAATETDDPITEILDQQHPPKGRLFGFSTFKPSSTYIQLDEQ